jgi:probable rRNA maturation factor
MSRDSSRDDGSRAGAANEVEISVEGIDTPPWLEKARAFALAALARQGKAGWDLSILICDDAFIKGLNKQYRDKDEATDVLSFEQGDSYKGPFGEERFLAGDIVISLDALARNALDFGISPDEEMRRLITHGILHLSGMDHEDNDPSRPMLLLQEEILRDLAASGGPTIL